MTDTAVKSQWALLHLLIATSHRDTSRDASPGMLLWERRGSPLMRPIRGAPSVCLATASPQCFGRRVRPRALIDEIKDLLETPSSPSQGRPDATASGAHLIEKRDRFIASRIDTTLHEGEIGMLFLGMLHSIAPLLAKDIKLLNLLPFDRTARRIKRALQR